MAAILQETFSFLFHENSCIWIISLKLVLNGQFNNKSALVQIMAWYRQAALRWSPQDLIDDWLTMVQGFACCLMVPIHSLNQCWSNVKMVYSIPRRQWVNSLWDSNAMCQQKFGSTLVQMMVCCLVAPSHYLNQCWLIINLPGNTHGIHL